MSIRTIPLSAIPAQIVSAVVNEQAFQIEIRQLGGSLFSTTTVDGEIVASSVRAVSRGSITPWPSSVVGTSVVWVDTQGDDDPQYEGLGSRWVLAFEEAVS